MIQLAVAVRHLVPVLLLFLDLVGSLVLELVVETILLVVETSLVTEALVDQMAVDWDDQAVEEWQTVEE
jgi:hypothetical protein